jgi:hypothetical protein
MENTDVIENTEKEKVSIISVKMTEKGRNTFLDMLQEHMGYIEEEICEQIVNDTTDWMNVNYKDLLDFYIRAVEEGLVPKQQFMKIVDENNRLIQEMKNMKLKKETIDEPKLNYKNLKDMNGWDLRKLAKKMDIKITKGTTKEQIYKMVRENIKE